MLTPATFLRPAGRIDPDLMGGTAKATATLTKLITTAQTKTSDETTQECFVYWKAFQQIADDQMSTPAMQRDRDKTDQYSGEQLAHWQQVAREYETCYQRRTTGTPGYPPATSFVASVAPKW